MMAANNLIIGAISGDIIGSVYEWHNIKTTDFPLFQNRSTFTDDSVLTFATMDVLLNNGDYVKAYQQYSRHFHNKGYGSSFHDWVYSENPRPYNSWGNGSAMRISPVGWAFDALDEVLAEAKKSAEVTHNHPEGIKGAQATVSAIYLARTGKSKEEIKSYIIDTFGYDLDRKLDEIRPSYKFEVSCQRSVPEAIIAFLESDSYENAIRLAVSLGGDSDTIACITGGIAEAFYGAVPAQIADNVLRLLPDDILSLVGKFSEKYGKRQK